jgi:hypothetical protein
VRVPCLAAFLLIAGAHLSPVAAQSAESPAKACGNPSASDVSASVPCRVETSIFAAAEAPAIFSDIKVRSTDLLEASLSVENKGASLAYAPFLYGLSLYRPLISELRLRVAQKDNLTTFGVGTQINPLSPRSGRGKALWMAQGGTRPPLQQLSDKLRARKTTLEGELGGLLEDYRKASTFAPGMTRENLEALRRKQLLLVDEIANKAAELRPIADQLAALEAADARFASTRVQTFYTRLLDARVPVVGFSYNATVFPLLAGSVKDADNDGLNDVDHQLKKHSLSASVDWRLSRRLQVGGLFAREWERASAEAGTSYADMTGFSVTVGGIVAILDSAYEESAAFKESLFIPSVVVGASVEYRSCGNVGDAGVSCPDSLKRLVALTPFVDLRVSKTAQFRIGAPLKFSTPVQSGSTATDLGVLTAFVLQLGEPK